MKNRSIIYIGFSFILVFYGFQNDVKAQEFAFTMYFQDSAGNKDSIQLGYDLNSTDSIGNDFGEEDISGLTRDEELEVRITNAAEFESRQPTRESKIYVTGNYCDEFWFPRVAIEITSSNWPLTAMWEQSIFEDDCRIGTIFTVYEPGGWFDVGGCCSDFQDFDEYVFLSDSNKVTFTEAFDIDDNYSSGYINELGEEISTFYFAFGNENMFNVGTQEKKIKAGLFVYPNPVSDILYIHETNLPGMEWTLYDMVGRKIKKGRGQSVEMYDLEDGIYFLRMDHQSIKLILAK